MDHTIKSPNKPAQPGPAPYWPDLLAAAGETDAPVTEPEFILDLMRPREERRT